MIGDEFMRNFFDKKYAKDQLGSLLRRDAMWAVYSGDKYLASSSMGLNYSGPDTRHDLRDSEQFVDWMDARAAQADALALDLTSYMDYVRFKRCVFGCIGREEMSLQQSYFKRAGMALYGIDVVAHGKAFEDVFWEEGFRACDSRGLSSDIASSRCDSIIARLDGFTSGWNALKTLESSWDSAYEIRFQDGRGIAFATMPMADRYLAGFCGRVRFFSAEARQSGGRFEGADIYPEVARHDWYDADRMSVVVDFVRSVRCQDCEILDGAACACRF